MLIICLPQFVYSTIDAPKFKKKYLLLKYISIRHLGSGLLETIDNWHLCCCMNQSKANSVTENLYIQYKFCVSEYSFGFVVCRLQQFYYFCKD